MRNFFAHWRILTALVAVIVLAIFTLPADEADAAPPLAERLRQHAQAIASDPGHAEAVLAAQGYRVRHQHYGVGGFLVSTIEAALGNVAGARPERLFIVGSQLDPAPDGEGNGAAAVLELARLLKTLRPAAGTEIRFVLFRAPVPQPVDARDEPSSARAAPLVGDPGNFIAFVGPAAAAGPVRQALAAFRDDADFLSGGIAAPSYVQALTMASQPSAGAGDGEALLITDTAFVRYPYFQAAQSEGDSEHANLARVVAGLARTLAALAAAPSS